ncbi:alkaline phosphatase family protein [Mucilaginibacter psychrotolerans]|uniref:Alkaline phosphatase family protein n=1 Tax=Mucilaginibacter psychrotolerans TaxID=1524096 RepID=A0A4Y8S730_9SPHI|nr:alkaline phosphatase family protein [Mucilaginibacter psychrotolerans]TFF34421.1 alkaline phosphatase family protein [Mucilaginibacter psychrotolerans]
MKKYSLLVALMMLCFAGICQKQQIADTTQKVIPGRKNSLAQQKKPYVILISADGFRWDYVDKYNAPNLKRFRRDGVHAKSMVPSYPSVTFPNHYAMVSGLYPSHSGLVNNSFYDRNRNDSYSMSNKAKVADGSWYGGTPLWVLAEQQKMLAASFYWVASEAAIKNTRPTYYYIYNEQIDMNNRIAAVVNWLKLPPEERPHFITFYLPQVDHAGHTYGPDAPETGREVLYVDSAVNALYKAVKTTGLDVNFVFVADHGMTQIENKSPLGIPAGIDTAKFRISGDGTLVELYAKDKTAIQSTFDQLTKDAQGDYKVYLKTNMPAKFHYGASDDWHNRIGDILLIPEWPKVFNLAKRTNLHPGWHGFDPTVVKDMHATFYAWGPAFRKRITIKSFPNVDVYNMVSELLGLKITDKVDGTRALAKKILVKKVLKRRNETIN